MKINRPASISVLAVVVFALISATSSHALDSSDWNNKWFKTNFKVKSVCEDSQSSKLFKSAASAPTYIYFISTAEVVIALNIEGQWVVTGSVPLTQLFGGADDGVYETVNEVTISSTGESFTLYFIFRLTGKEKNGALSSGKVASIAGYSLYKMDEDCAATLTFSGSYVITSKVPVEVQTIVNGQL
jgi:hypothetical protein